MSLADFCVRRPVFTTMLVMLFVVTGVFSFRDLSVDLLPKADPATVVVFLNLPGASPEELNSAVVEPTEQALSSIAGIDEMQSLIREGSGRITLRFVLERDINDAAQDVREKVAQALKELPPEVEPPIIAKVDPDADPVISFALSGSLPLRALTEIADKQIRRAVATVDGVGEVTISGGQAREIQVILDIEKLNAHGLTVDRVRDAIVSENVEVPGGYIQQGDAELTLRTLGRHRVDQPVLEHRGRDHRRAARRSGCATSRASKTRRRKRGRPRSSTASARWSWTCGGSRARTPSRWSRRCARSWMCCAARCRRR